MQWGKRGLIFRCRDPSPAYATTIARPTRTDGGGGGGDCPVGNCVSISSNKQGMGAKDSRRGSQELLGLVASHQCSKHPTERWKHTRAEFHRAQHACQRPRHATHYESQRQESQMSDKDMQMQIRPACKPSRQQMTSYAVCLSAVISEHDNYWWYCNALRYFFRQGSSNRRQRHHVDATMPDAAAAQGSICSRRQ